MWPSFLVFQAVSTQWRTGMGGASGLDYNVLPWVMRLHNVDDEAPAHHGNICLTIWQPRAVGPYLLTRAVLTS
ncbi:DUF1799 domain-containing protein [Enterobacter sp.]|uniref:DUF1799 domain-containing protein n=1 Tax=Enterobacter sp. TaxID=42895 RepID=UPI0031D1DDDE